MTFGKKIYHLKFKYLFSGKDGLIVASFCSVYVSSDLPRSTKKKNRHWMLEIFLVSCRKNLGLHRYFFPLLYDWSCKLAPPSRPIRDRSKTNQDVVTRVFPRFRQFDQFYFEFSLITFTRPARPIATSTSMNNS